VCATTTVMVTTLVTVTTDHQDTAAQEVCRTLLATPTPATIWDHAPQLVITTICATATTDQVDTPAQEITTTHVILTPATCKDHACTMVTDTLLVTATTAHKDKPAADLPHHQHLAQTDQTSSTANSTTTVHLNVK